MYNLFLWASVLLFVLSLFTSNNRGRNKYSAFFGALIIFVYMIFSAFFVVSDYFTGEGINDAVVFHLRYGLEGSGFGDYYLIIGIGVGFFIASMALSIFYYRLFTKTFLEGQKKLKRFISLGSLVFALILHPTSHFLTTSTLKTLGIENPLSVKYDFFEYYEEPKISESSSGHPNVVYIFAESFEDTYFDESIFPQLVKDLRPIREKSLSFTEIHQVYGTGWTIAGMTAAICGIPLVTPTTNEHSPQGNSMSKMSTFYSGAVCLSDMLHKEGYKLVYRSGSPLEFAGVDKLYRTHKFSDIKGIKELKPLLKNPNYQTPWGLYDDTLFDIAFEDFKKLSKTKQKFALYLSTMDTHHPYGHVSKSCKAQKYNDGSNSMLNAVACSDELIAKFIKQITESQYGKNTIIVVGSDHLAMHNMAIDMLNKGTRRNQFMIIDPRVTDGKKIEKAGTTLDIGATLISVLGYEGKLGLGRNLLGKEPTLMEELPKFDKILSAWSNEISLFWQFPKIIEPLELDSNKKGLVIGKAFYNYPILLRFNANLEVNPFFEVKVKFFETPKLFGYLHDFKADEPFLWIDKCSRINALDSDQDTTTKSKYCFAYGKIGGEIKLDKLSGQKSISLEELKEIAKLPSNDNNASKRRESLVGIKEK